MSSLQLVSVWDPRANGPYRGLLPHTAMDLARQDALTPRPAPAVPAPRPLPRIAPGGQLARVLERAKPGCYYTTRELAALAQIPHVTVGDVIRRLTALDRILKRMSDDSHDAVGGRSRTVMLYAVKS